MHAELQQEPLPQDDSLSSRLKYYAVMSSAILAGAALTVRRDPRARWVGMAALGVVLVLAYGLTRNSPEALASSPSPTSPAVEKASQAVVVRSSGEIETLKAALAQQNATNQQLVTSIDELRAEQDKLRRQVAALQAAKPVVGTAGTTGSITPAPRPPAKPLPAKKAEQSDTRSVPYPAPEARHVPYPKPN